MILISGGGKWSNYDVLTGLHKALKRRGVEVHPYHLDRHLDDAVAWIRHQRELHGEPELPKEELLAAGMFQAGEQAVLRGLAYGAHAAIVITGLFLNPAISSLFGRARIPTLLYGTESPYDDDVLAKVAPAYAIATTNERTSVAAMQAAVDEKASATTVMHLPLGYDRDQHYPGAGADVDAPTHDVVFVGSVFPARDRLLRGVDWDALGVDLGLYGVFKTMPHESPLWRYCRATPEDPYDLVPNRLAVAIHSRAKIVVNLFREEAFRKSWDNVITVTGAESVGPRLIECAAAGQFVISEWRAELDEPPWAGLVPTFRTADELRELVGRYLADDAARATIEERLPAAVGGWSYDDRAATIIQSLQEVRAVMI